MRNFKNDLEKVLMEIGASETMKFPFNETETFRETNIDVLGISVRSSNGLRRQGVYTLGGIIDNWNDITRWRGLGITSVNEIKKNFYEYYYSSLTDDEVDKFWSRFVEANCIGV